MAKRSDSEPKSDAAPPANAFIPPIIGGVLEVIYLFLAWGKLPFVITVFLGLFVFVAGALVGQAAKMILYPARASNGFIQKVILGIIVCVAVLTVLGMAGTLSSLFLGEPIDLRQYMRPDLVSRQNISTDPRKLSPIPFDEFEPVRITAGAEKERQATALEAMLFQWIKAGAIPPAQVDGLGFAFEIESFDNFYSAFNAQLIFQRDKTEKPLQARLVDGIALIQSTAEDGSRTYRQVPWFIDRHNGLEPDPLKAKQNTLFGILPNKGDRLILIAKLVSLNKEQLILSAADVACELDIVQ